MNILNVGMIEPSDLCGIQDLEAGRLTRVRMVTAYLEIVSMVAARTCNTNLECLKICLGFELNLVRMLFSKPLKISAV